jgi:hypothetical protein
MWNRRPRVLVLLVPLAAALACGSATEECGALAHGYASALEEARKCTPAEQDPCTVSVQSALETTGCTAAVPAGRQARLEDLARSAATLGCPSRDATATCLSATQGFACALDASGAYSCTAF